MKVSQYRDLIDALVQAFNSVKSAATPEEHSRETEWLKKTAHELTTASCPRATLKDKERAQYWLNSTSKYLSGELPQHHE